MRVYTTRYTMHWSPLALPAATLISHYCVSHMPLNYYYCDSNVPLAPAHPLTGDTSNTPRSIDGPSRRGKPSTYVSPGSEYRGRTSCPRPSLRGCASLGTGGRNMHSVYGRGQRACASSVAQVSSGRACITICVPHRVSFETGRNEN